MDVWRSQQKNTGKAVTSFRRTTLVDAWIFLNSCARRHNSVGTGLAAFASYLSLEKHPALTARKSINAMSLPGTFPKSSLVRPICDSTALFVPGRGPPLQ
eukprot:4526639-Pyramimonas_sp.AAC.1